MTPGGFEGHPGLRQRTATAVVRTKVSSGGAEAEEVVVGLVVEEAAEAAEVAA